jgi:RNA polymerase sigma-70 factor (ECF subfamily)
MKNTGHTDDRALIGACIDRDLEAWNLLIGKYSRLVDISIAGRLKKYGFVLPQEDVEDIRQDVFTMIWHEDKLKNIANADDISYWIAIVSGNMAIDYIRKNGIRENLKTIPIHEKLQEKEFADIIPAKTTKSDDELYRKEISERIDKAIRDLPSREKLIIKLYLIHDKKYDAIADMLDLPKGTVSSYIKRAKEKLKKQLKDFK